MGVRKRRSGAARAMPVFDAPAFLDQPVAPERHSPRVARLSHFAQASRGGSDTLGVLRRKAQDLSMNVVWMIAGIGVVGASARLFVWLRGRGRERHLGFVSHQWITEHRPSFGSDRDM
jgi:hypothetical protein